MQNPILQILNQNNPMFQRINEIKQLMAGRNPQEVYKNLMNTNPKFKEFVKKNETKSLEEIALEYDLNLDLIKKFM